MELVPVRFTAGIHQVLVNSEEISRQRSNFSVCCDKHKMYKEGSLVETVSHRDLCKMKF